jgi:hypothetical protein
LPDAQPLAFAASSPGGWELGGMMEKVDVTFSRPPNPAGEAGCRQLIQVAILIG